MRELEHTPYNVDAPIHSFRALKQAVEAGEVPRPDVLPLLSLNGTTEMRSPLIKGWLHLYTGAPKIGKTELFFQTILNWTEDRRTLWFSEEGLSVWTEKTYRTPWSIMGETGDFHFAYANDKDTSWMQSVITQMADNGGLDVVVIDTIKLLGIMEENKPGEIRAALKPYYNLCHGKGITIILVHHDRKVGGKFGNQISGSNAFAASVDVTISIDRHSQVDNDNKRVVEVTGRADNFQFIYELDRDSGEMKILGDPANMNQLGMKIRIMAALGVDELTTSQLRDIMSGDGKGEVSRSIVGKMLTTMAQNGEVLRFPDIVEGKLPRVTVRWTMKE